MENISWLEKHVWVKDEHWDAISDEESKLDRLLASPGKDVLSRKGSDVSLAASPETSLDLNAPLAGLGKNVLSRRDESELFVGGSEFNQPPAASPDTLPDVELGGAKIDLSALNSRTLPNVSGVETAFIYNRDKRDSSTYDESKESTYSPAMLVELVGLATFVEDPWG